MRKAQMRSFIAAAVIFGLVGPAAKAGASPAFYENTQLTGSYYPTEHEIGDDVPFTGTFLVDEFQVGYSLPDAATDLTIRFYNVAATGGHGDLLAEFSEPTLPNGFVLVDVNLAATGQQFLWNDSTRGYGWISLQFSNPDAGWLTATGGGSSDRAEDITAGTFFSFGGVPEASFYVQVHGVQVHEPTSMSLLAFGACTLLLFSYVRQRQAPKGNNHSEAAAT
jgi:hypothetical protein